MTVGEKIYTLRTQAGYSQEEFAELIGVSRQSVSKWETSAVIPDTEYVVKICKTLLISTDTLLLDKDLPTDSDNVAVVEQSTEKPREPRVEWIKRALLIVLAAVKTLLLCVSIYYFRRFLIWERNELHTIGYYINIVAYVANIATAICAICRLAVVDFIFCLGQKRYNKSMLGIAIALFALSVGMTVVSPLVTRYFEDVIVAGSTSALTAFYWWVALSSLPYLGLAISYIVVKSQF